MTSPPLHDTTLDPYTPNAFDDNDQANDFRQPHLQSEVDDTDDFAHEGDYSTRMEELFDEGESDMPGDDEDDPEEAFVYTGIDAEEALGGYRDQLRDVLEAEHEDDEVVEEIEVEISLLHNDEKAGLQVEHPSCIFCAIILKKNANPAARWDPNTSLGYCVITDNSRQCSLAHRNTLQTVETLFTSDYLETTLLCSSTFSPPAQCQYWDVPFSSL
jgi:hypothetical protein